MRLAVANAPVRNIISGNNIKRWNMVNKRGYNYILRSDKYVLTERITLRKKRTQSGMKK